MASPETHPAQKIVTIGLASSVITTSMAGVSVAQENENLPNECPAVAPVVPPTQPSVPSEEDINRATQALEEAEEVQRQQEALLAAKEESQAQAAEELATLEAQYRQAHDDHQRLSQLTEEELQLNQGANERAVENAQQAQANATTRAQELNNEHAVAEQGLNAATHQRDQAKAELKEAEIAFDMKLAEGVSSENPQETPQRPSTQELDANIQKITAQRDELRLHIDNAQKDKERLTSEQTTLQETLADKERELARLDTELTQARQRLTETEEARAQAQNVADAARQKLAELTSSTNPDSHTEEKTRELRELEQQIMQAEQEVATHDATLEELNRQIQDAQTSQEALTRTLDDLNTQVQQAQLRVNDLSTQITAHEEELAELDTALKNLTTELEDVRKKIAAEENKHSEVTFTREELVNPLGNATDLALYRSENGVFTRVTELAAPPADLSNYVLRARGRDGRDLSLIHI